MRLSDLSIARPVLAWVIMFALIVFGAVSLTRLGVSYMPDVDFPILSVRVSWEGAAPEIMEAEIVDRMERRLITVEGLREMVSSVGQGSASINLEFDIERNVDAALQEGDFLRAGDLEALALLDHLHELRGIRQRVRRAGDAAALL